MNTISEPIQPAASTSSAFFRWALGAVVVSAIGYGLYTGQVTAGLLWAIEELQAAGPLGAVAFVLLYAVATVLALPGGILTIAAGFLYGPVWGFAVAVASSNLGASAAFWLGRTALRERVSGWVKDSPRFTALDRALEDGGYKLAMLIRMSPLFPFNLVNYALGLTKMQYRHYLLGGAIGMAPGTFLYVSVGAGIGELSQLTSGAGDTGVGGKVLLVAGILATIAVTAWITRTANRALESQLEIES